MPWTIFAFIISLLYMHLRASVYQLSWAGSVPSSADLSRKQARAGGRSGPEAFRDQPSWAEAFRHQRGREAELGQKRAGGNVGCAGTTRAHATGKKNSAGRR